jgi:hypothetical protein
MKAFALSFLVIPLAACTAVPSGPEVLVLPGTSISLDQFRSDDLACRQFARDAFVKNAKPSQKQYDNGYQQCMYAKGHRLPLHSSLAVTPPGYPPPYPAGRPPQ